MPGVTTGRFGMTDMTMSWIPHMVKQPFRAKAMSATEKISTVLVQGMVDVLDPDD